MDLVGLFFSSLFAATLLPMFSEGVLYYLLTQGQSPWLLLLIATAGNTLGACLNWALGRYLLRFRDRRWFYLDTTRLATWQVRFQRYGVWSLLFSWLPIIGDPLTFVAGVLKVQFPVFLILVAVGKAARYLVVIFLYQ